MVNFKFINSRLINQTKLLYLKCIRSQKSIIRHCTIRRAILYAPGNDMRKIEKALSLKLDCIAFDLVTINEENDVKARTTVHDFLNEGSPTTNDPEWCVKVNPIQTGNIFVSDMEAILSAKKLPAGIILSDVDAVDSLRWFTEQLWKKLLERPENDRGPLKLLITVGSPRAVMLLRDICEKAQDLASMAPIIPSAIIFDHIELVNYLGGVGTSHGIEILYARQKTVLVAKAFGLQAIDMYSTNPKALEELQKECREGVCMGFTGKQVIYPVHLAIVQKEFTPTRSMVSRARVIVKKLSQKEENDMSGYTPERIPTVADPKLQVANHIVKVATATCKTQAE